jgi:hypothetical protein
MKLLLIAITFGFAALSPALAITDADIAPAALVGKTLTFTIESAGGGPFADMGTWTGTFGANSFSTQNLTGNTVGISTTYTTAVNGTFTEVALPKIVEGSGAAMITLFTSNGVGRYEMNFAPLGAAFQIGSFTIDAPAANGAKISVKSRNVEIADGSTEGLRFFVLAGRKIEIQTITITNIGTKNLKGLSFSKSGKGKDEFIISNLSKKTLAPGASAKLKITFKPKSTDTKKATLRIKSKGREKSTFTIKLIGDTITLTF